MTRDLVLFLSFLLAHLTMGQAGSLDSTFDADGVRLFQQSWGLRWLGTLALSDGSAILYGAHSITSTHAEACFTRILPDGSTDPDWGMNGYTYIDTGVYAVPKCMLQADDGSYYAAGHFDDGIWPTTDIGILFHLLPNGQPDPAFGAAGVVVREEIGMINGMRQWNGDRLIMCGGNGTSDSHAWFMRCQADGSLDTSFSSDGLVGDSAMGIGLWDLDVLDDGSIVGAGSIAIDWSNTQPVFVRVDSVGVLMPAFGAGGVLQADFISSEGRAYAVTSLGNSFVASGTTAISNISSNAFLVQLGDDGALDPSFNGGDVLIIDRDALDNAEALLVDEVGRILICGNAGSSVNDCQPMVARYLPTGEVDTTFGSDGITSVPMLGGYTTAMQMAMMPNGRVLVAGYAAAVPYGFAFRLLNSDDQTTQQAEYGTSTIRVRPDAGGSQLWIDLPDTWASGLLVDVMDTSGRTIQRSHHQGAPSLELSGLPTGTYLARISDGIHRAVARFVKL